MHEFSLAQELLDRVETLRREHSAVRVVGVRVEIGDESGIEPECLRSALDALTTGPGGPRVELQTIRGDCLLLRDVTLENDE